MNRFAGVLAAVLAAASLPAARVAPPPPVAEALAILQRGGAELASGWQYEETLTNAEGSTRLSYNPRRSPGERWRVIVVDGRPPSDAERKRLAAQALAAGGDVGNGLGIGAGWLAASDYRLVKTTAKTLIYQLQPKPAEDADEATKKLLSHLAGQFIISRADHRPLSLRLDNFESFSPRFGVEIEAFGFRIEFTRLGTTGPVIAVRTSNSTRGKIFWIKSFAERTEVVLSRFAPVAATASGK